MIGKVAWEKKVGDQKVHVEGFGIYRSFTARVNFNAAAATALGGTPATTPPTRPAAAAAARSRSMT